MSGIFKEFLEHKRQVTQYRNGPRICIDYFLRGSIQIANKHMEGAQHHSSFLCNPMDSSSNGILQARILEWVAFLFSRGSSQPRDRMNSGLLHCRWILHQLSHKGSPRILEWEPIPSPVDLPDSGIELGSPALQAESLPTELPGKPTLHTNSR